jgi:hypothetical protein
MQKTLSDRIIEYVSPQTAVKRYKARAMIGAYEKGGYNGASRTRAAIGNFNPTRIG